MDSKIINSHQCSLEKSHAVLIEYDLILKSNQVLGLFRQKQILRYNRHKNLKKQDNEDCFIQLLNAWLCFINKKFPTRHRSRPAATSKMETC